MNKKCLCGMQFRKKSQLNQHLKINARKEGHKEIKADPFELPIRKQKKIFDKR